MTDWSLPQLLRGLHDDISQRLRLARQSFAHTSTKGDASERVWLELLQKYLPARYRAERAHVVDSNGQFGDQIDVVVFDRQYSPFIFEFEEQRVVPAESVYALFEAKQTISAAHITYAQRKAASVRRLHRTSLPIPHAGGTYPAKKPPPILAGILTFESEWSPPLGQCLLESLSDATDDTRLDLGCIAAHGILSCGPDGCHSTTVSDKAATMFLLELIARLQSLATVPMIDIRAYARWLEGSPEGNAVT
jgi:hypothetical protein